MKNQELYHKTIDILVKAYLNDTLEHINSCACAVGNMIAANMGIKIVPNENPHIQKYRWDNGMSYASWIMAVSMGEPKNQYLDKDGDLQIKSTGYTLTQIAKIEAAFESVHEGLLSYQFPKDIQFKGLMAVVEALDIIHENTDKDLTQTVKAKFQKV